jgi:hypothetical protein
MNACVSKSPESTARSIRTLRRPAVSADNVSEKEDFNRAKRTAWDLAVFAADPLSLIYKQTTSGHVTIYKR